MATVKRKTGRPPTYTDETIEEGAQSLLDWFAEDEERCWLKDWCIENHLLPEHVSRFAAKNSVFRAALHEAEQIQESRIVQGGLRGKFNPKVTCLVLTAKHNWVTEQKLDVTARTDGQSIRDTLTETLPEDPAEARVFLERLANGSGTGGEAKALQEAAQGELYLMDLIDQAQQLPSALAV